MKSIQSILEEILTTEAIGVQKYKDDNEEVGDEDEVLATEEKEFHWGVFSKGGSIGSSGKEEPQEIFATPEEAKAYAKRRRSQLSPGEKKHYGMGYVTKKIKGPIPQKNNRK